jgi:hypothetical protein
LRSSLDHAGYTDFMVGDHVFRAQVVDSNLKSEVAASVRSTDYSGAYSFKRWYWSLDLDLNEVLHACRVESDKLAIYCAYHAVIDKYGFDTGPMDAEARKAGVVTALASMTCADALWHKHFVDTHCVLWALAQAHQP